MGSALGSIAVVSIEKAEEDGTFEASLGYIMNMGDLFIFCSPLPRLPLVFKVFVLMFSCLFV